MGDRKRVNVERDRLSGLPDDLIHKILSFAGIKYAVETSVLSPRWRYIWTSMPYLSFSSEDFRTLPKFSNFVKHVLSGRNNQIEVSSVELTFRGKVSQPFVKRILNYALSHNVQQLNFTCLYEKDTRKKTTFPLSLFTFQTLKHFNLTVHSHDHSIMTSPTWELPALVTLSLHYVTLHEDSTGKGAGLFSHFSNLKNLTLNDCRLLGSNGSSICHPGLSSLTLENGYMGIGVVTPQLKILTIKNCRMIHLISAPNLSSLLYKDHFGGYHVYDPLKLSTDLLHLEKAEVCIDYVYPHSPNEEGACSNKVKDFTQKIVSLLQQLHNVKFLSLNLELVKLLSLSVELISHQPSPFGYLKSLKIYPTCLYQPEVVVSSVVKNYLLDGSPSATFTMVSHEEVRAVKDVALARNLMGELYVLLDRWKQNGVTNNAYTKQDKAPMESHMTTLHEQREVENHSPQQDTEMKDHFLESMTHIESYWKNLSKLLVKGYANTRRVISLLRKIDEVLKKVPRSHQATLQARFSELRAEAETIMENMMDRMKLQCDKKPGFFRERATSSQQCS